MSGIEGTKTSQERKWFLARLADGDFGLAKTYWLFGVLAGIIINFIVGIIPSLDVLAVVLTLAVVYQVVVLLGVWQAANKYQGRPAWSILAKIGAVLGWMGALGSVGVLIQILGYA